MNRKYCCPKKTGLIRGFEVTLTCTGMSKNADLAHYFLPDFWTLEKLSKMPVINGLRGITWGPKIGQRKVTDLDGLYLYP
jgi:hypothetical protein